MSEIESSTEAHYTRGDLGQSILTALKRMGKDLDALKPEDLAPVDEFHIRGREATLELAAVCHLNSGQRVLDVGCGLGGSARYLAATFGCRVTGLDLTKAYVETAAMLSERVGLAEKVEFHQGSALDMPFADGAFDLVWTEHAQMNIADKRRLYGEIFRVLKPGGRFVFHDILQGTGGEPHFPTPWAMVPCYSALIAPGDLRALLESLGYSVQAWQDKTAAGREWSQARVAVLREKGPPLLGVHTLLGADAMRILENNLRNLQENRIALVQAVLEMPG